MKLLLSFLVIYTLNIPQKELKGKITDRETSKNLMGIMVIINQKDTVYTNMNGYFIVKNIQHIESIDVKSLEHNNGDIFMVRY